MVEFESIEDASTVIFVIILISVVIAVCWESTRVRERPLIATAVVVLRELQPQSTDNMQSNSEGTTAAQSMQTSSTNSSDTTTLAASQTTLQKNSNLPETSNVGLCSECTTICDTTTVSDDVDSTSSDVSVNSISYEKCDDENQPRTCQNSDNHVESISQPSCDIDLSNEDNNLLSESDTDPRSSKGCRRRHANPKDQSADSSSPNTVSECHDKNINELNTSSPSNSSRPLGSIRIRLKFLDDTQRTVYGLMNEQVIAFKRTHFAGEIGNRRVVRLIFNGQLLNQDLTTLGQYGLFDNCVVHCHISQPQPQSNNNARSTSGMTSQDDDELDLSELLVPSLFGILIVLWWVRYEYSHLFSMSATILMVGLTVMLLISQYALTITLNVSFGSNTRTNQSNQQPNGRTEEENMRSPASENLSTNSSSTNSTSSPQLSIESS